MAQVKIKTVPIQGKVNSQDVDVKESGSSLKDVLESAGKSWTGMQVAIDGEPVDATKSHLVHVKAGATVTLTERARGS
ncbi:MAG: hypothetical protein KBE09_04305 [Candidatus Pacebacteria bacterium]|nr:hypothetical protein [Candidatus Paceibacterota bacterium]